jgi:hypothetical protein
VQKVRGGIVDDLHLRIGGEGFEAAVRFRHAEGVGLGARTALVRTGDGDDVDETQPTDRVDVMSPTKPGPTRPIPILCGAANEWSSD